MIAMAIPIRFIHLSPSSFIYFISPATKQYRGWGRFRNFVPFDGCTKLGPQPLASFPRRGGGWLSGRGFWPLPDHQDQLRALHIVEDKQSVVDVADAIALVAVDSVD